MARRPIDRYATAEAIAAEVRAWRRGLQVQAYDYGWLEFLRLQARRHRGRLVALVLVVASAIVVGVAGVRANGANENAAGRLGERLGAAAAHHALQRDLHQAEALGAQALLYAPRSRDAWGAMAATYADGGPTLVDALEMKGGCRNILADDGLLVCSTGAQVVMLRDGQVRARANARGNVTAIRAGRVWGADGFAQRGFQFAIGSPEVEVFDATRVAVSREGRVARSLDRRLYLDDSQVPELETAGFISDVVWLDEKRLVVVCGDGRVVLVEEGAESRIVRPHETLRYTVAVTAGDTLWMMGVGNVLVEVDLQGDVLRTLDWGGAKIVHMELSPGDRWLAAGDEEGVVTVIELDTQATAARIGAHGGRFASATWLGPDSVATASEGADVIRIWRMPETARSDRIDDSAPEFLWFDVENQRLHSASRRIGYAVRDLVSLRPVPDLVVPDVGGTLLGMVGYDGSVALLEKAASDSGPVLRVLEPDDFEVSRTLDLPTSVQSMMVEGHRLQFHDRDGVPILALQADGSITKVESTRADGNLSFQAGPHLITAASDGTMLVDGRRAQGQTGRIGCVTMVGKWLVTGSWDGIARVWRVSNLETVAILKGHGLRLRWVLATSDTTLLTIDWDGFVRRWDLSVLAADPEVLHKAAYERTRLRVYEDEATTRPE